VMLTWPSNDLEKQAQDILKTRIVEIARP